MFTALLIYGANGLNKEWMPRYEDNYFSWAYWSQTAASFLSLIAGEHHALKHFISFDKQRVKFLVIASFFYSEAKSILALVSKLEKTNTDERRGSGSIGENEALSSESVHYCETAPHGNKTVSFSNEA